MGLPHSFVDSCKHATSTVICSKDLHGLIRPCEGPICLLCSEFATFKLSVLVLRNSMDSFSPSVFSKQLYRLRSYVLTVSFPLWRLLNWRPLHYGVCWKETICLLPLLARRCSLFLLPWSVMVDNRDSFLIKFFIWWYYMVVFYGGILYGGIIWW